jgi:DNA polymerase-3 subunit epsilon
MKYLIIDTETTGLIDYNVTDPAKLPRIVTITWLLYNELHELLSTKNYMIKPNGFFIPKEATAIHGINTQTAIENGVELLPVLNELKDDLLIIDYVVAHNILYDLTVIKGECYRFGMKFYLKNLNKICTMKNTTNYCKLPSAFAGKYKYPKLTELYKKLFRCEMKGAHSSLDDTIGCAKCFFKLLDKGVIKCTKKSKTKIIRVKKVV